MKTDSSPALALGTRDPNETPAREIALWRIYLLRAGYLLIAVGMGMQKVPAFLVVVCRQDLRRPLQQMRLALRANSARQIAGDSLHRLADRQRFPVSVPGIAVGSMVSFVKRWQRGRGALRRDICIAVELILDPGSGLSQLPEGDVGRDGQLDAPHFAATDDRDDVFGRDEAFQFLNRDFPVRISNLIAELNRRGGRRDVSEDF